MPEGTETTGLCSLDAALSPACQRIWLGALHQLALADGDFSEEEQHLLNHELKAELPEDSWDAIHQPGDGALVHRFGVGSELAEQFLRSAVMVALADGHISEPELELLRRWSRELQVAEAVVAQLNVDVCGVPHPQALDGLRQWLDGVEPHDPAVARFLVKLIPAQCPFERDVVLFGRKLVHIPPMCKINPLYDQLVALRFRCLCRLEEPDSRDAT
ncbi:Mo-dependent nitrogenase C-terminal domain-containing protein [Synechococcus sp. CS-1328]|uniref:Mo-dependent nitrogenase C-terminal domain-containing protein n=1 Tax=Synechococcus sp. CS-1328 TaxID=2847976 RepID=UPI00223BB0E9|nr:Mo-dependent nitrogenase C-terminal domain-containing protein [Synechococcus sp. CS-1328]MCT0226333.1 Mo-dependent nitrogenase [Synechococcus sp. CS-1328]